MEKKYFKKIKHNHSRNLKVVLRELRRCSEQGGASLEYLAQKCGVSTRQIYRYLNELQAMGFEILRSSNLLPGERGGYTVREPENAKNGPEFGLMSILVELNQYKNELQAAKVFIKEWLLRVWLSQLGIVLPLTQPIIFYDLNDAVHVSRQTMVFSDSAEELVEDVKLKVSPKVVTSVSRAFMPEMVSKQRYSDGSYIINLKTKRPAELSGLLVQWGHDVEILEPGWLQHRLIENCKAILFAHRQRKIAKTSLYSPEDKMLFSY